MAAQQSARKECPSSNRGSVSRILRLALLAPDIVEAGGVGGATADGCLVRLGRRTHGALALQLGPLPLPRPWIGHEPVFIGSIPESFSARSGKAVVEAW